MAERVNPVKLKQDAERLEKAGRLDQAIALYRQIVEQNPRDWNTINKIGDLYAKINRTREAAEEYAKVADFYAKDGFLVRAIAMWKKVNKLDTAILDPYLKLAELYAKQGLMMEAKSQFQIVVDEYLKRGKTKDAAEILKKMAELDPGDLKVRSKLADIYTREGSGPKAVEEHIAIALELSKKGHLAEALQVLEKGLKIDPRSVRLRQELARVHLVQKNYDRAAHYLEEVVQESPNDVSLLARLGEAYIEGRKIEEAEALFKRLLEINPADEESRIQMGRVFLLQQKFDLAYAEFLPALDRLLQRKEGEKAAALLQQVVQRNPSHVKSLVKLAEIYRILQMEGAVSQTCSQLTEAYINEGAWEQAASVLETLVSREPQNQQHRTKLEFVRSRAGGKRPASAPAQILDTVEEMEFDLDQPAPGELAPKARVPLEQPAPVHRAPQPAAVHPAPAPAPTPVAPARPTIEVSGPLSGEDSEFIDEHLAEGRVFRKYGLVDKAIDQFEAVVARFPDHFEARQDLREVYKEKGLPAKAAEQCLALAEICRLRGDAAAAVAHEADAQALQPAPAQAPRQGPTPPRAAPAPPPVREAEIALEEKDEPFSLAVEEEEISLDLGDTHLGEEEAPAASPAVDLVFEEEVLEEPELLPQFADEVPVESELVIEAEIEETPAPVALHHPGPQLAAASLDLGLEEEELTFPAALEEDVAPATFGAPPPLAGRGAPPSAVPDDVARALEEVEQYISLGFVDDARDALRELVERQGRHPAIEAKAQELGLDLGEVAGPEAPNEVLEEETAFETAPAADSDLVTLDLGLDLSEAMPSLEERDSDLVAELPPPTFSTSPATSPEIEPSVEELVSELPPYRKAEPALAPPVGQDFESALELSELFDAQSVAEPDGSPQATEFGDSGLAEIFKEFKRGVDKQLGKEDYDTRYNLGIAYKEMGLLDEAIAEFQLAAKDEARLLECSSMLGICFVEKGMPKLAVKWFEKGLKAPGRSEEEYQGLRYDLAAAHEAAGELDEALSLFTDLYGQNANFRDVAAKVRQLRGGA